MARWSFWVSQGGMVVAEGDCPDEATAVRECKHYVAMYGQDGPVVGMTHPSDDDEPIEVEA